MELKKKYIDGKVRITHPSGHIDEYDKRHLERRKENFIKRRAELDKDISIINEDIAKL